MRKAAVDAGRPVAVLVDLQGPKIRLAKFADGPHDCRMEPVAVQFSVVLARDVEFVGVFRNVAFFLGRQSQLCRKLARW